MTSKWKAVIAIAAGILVYECWQCGDKSTNRMGDIVIPTDSILWGEYAEYNKEYFGNTLPYATLVYTDIIDEHGGHPMADTHLKDGVYHIRIDKQFNPILKVADISMLHEMCHIKLDASDELSLTVSNDEAHGTKFQNCMLDLASHGAMHDLW